MQETFRKIDPKNLNNLRAVRKRLQEQKAPLQAIMYLDAQIANREKQIKEAGLQAREEARADQELALQSQEVVIKQQEATTKAFEASIEAQKSKVARQLNLTMDVLYNATADSVATASTILESPLKPGETELERVNRARGVLEQKESGKGVTIKNSLDSIGDFLKFTFKEAEAKKFGGMTAEAFTELEKGVTQIPTAMRDINQMNTSLQTYIDAGGQTGSFANFKTAMLKGLRGLGVELKDDLLAQTNEGEFINTLSTKYVFPLVKNFPGALAAKELDRLERLGPDAAKQPENIVRLITAVETDLTQQNYIYNQAVSHLETNDTLQNFRPGKVAIEFQRKFQRLESLKDKHQAYLANPQSAPRLTQAEQTEATKIQNELRIL